MAKKLPIVSLSKKKDNYYADYLRLDEAIIDIANIINTKDKRITDKEKMKYIKKRLKSLWPKRNVAGD